MPGSALSVRPSIGSSANRWRNSEWSASSGSVASSCSSASSECDRSSMRPSACCHAQARASPSSTAKRPTRTRPSNRRVASLAHTAESRSEKGPRGRRVASTTAATLRATAVGRERPVRTVRPMGRVELTGWASTQQIGTDGTVDSEQRVTLDRPVVDVLGPRCEGAGLSLLGRAAALRTQIDVGAGARRRDRPATPGFRAGPDRARPGRDCVLAGVTRPRGTRSAAGCSSGGAAGASRSSRSSASGWSCGRRSTASIRAGGRSTCWFSAGSTSP